MSAGRLPDNQDWCSIVRMHVWRNQQLV